MLDHSEKPPLPDPPDPRRHAGESFAVAWGLLLALLAAFAGLCVGQAMNLVGVEHYTGSPFPAAERTATFITAVTSVVAWLVFAGGGVVHLLRVARGAVVRHLAMMLLFASGGIVLGGIIAVILSLLTKGVA